MTNHFLTIRTAALAVCLITLSLLSPIKSRLAIVPIVKPAMPEAFGKLPMSFEANRRQADSGVKLLAHEVGYSLSPKATEAVHQSGARSRRLNFILECL